MKTITVIGARPQFIKAAALSKSLREIPGCQEILLHTGQHYDHEMSEVFFQELGIPKTEYNLGIGSGSHGQQTSKMLVAIEEVLLKEQPDVVIVYGDTNSTLAGALAAAKLCIPSAPVESGLRSFNRQMPEEINRVLTDHAAAILYAPTEAAVHNLFKEGIDQGRVELVGDVMYDAALFFAEKASAKKPLLKYPQISPNNYLLATIHRAENTDNCERLTAIFESLEELAATLPVVVPLHPRTRKALEAIDLMNRIASKLIILPPVGYLEMLNLEQQVRLIVTDSGGVQKEAFFQRVPCVTLRGETEWSELVTLGWNTLVFPSDRDSVCRSILSVLEQSCPLEDITTATLYGGGRAAQAISTHLNRVYSG